MDLPILSSTSRDAGITALRLMEMKAQKLWSGDDIPDGEDDPAASRFSLKVDGNIVKVYHETSTNIFRFNFTARVSIVHKDKAGGTQWALTDKQRGDLKQKFRHAAVDHGADQASNSLDSPVSLLDNVRQQDSAEEIVKDLRNLFRLSASCRQRSIPPSQSHWGIHNFIDTYVNEKTIGDIVLEVISHLMEAWGEQSILHTLKTIPMGDQQHIEGSCNIGPMSSSKAFAVIVLEFETWVQLKE